MNDSELKKRDNRQLSIALIALGVMFGGSCVRTCTLMFQADDCAVEWMALVTQGKLEEAYAEADRSFHETRADEFAATVKRLELVGGEPFVPTGDNNTTVNTLSGQATIKGKLKAKSGRTIPIAVELVLPRGMFSAWHVSGFRTRFPKPSIPSDGDRDQLVQTTLSNFADALKAHEFGPFRARWFPYGDASVSAKLQSTFASLSGDDEIIRTASGSKLTFDPQPKIDEGDLWLIGTSDTKPQVRFELAYYLDEGTWRLSKIAVYIDPAAKPKSP
jgi:hypothetical protein